MTVDNRSKIILDLCGGTGAWSRPYLEAGYDVRVITHPSNDVIEYDEYLDFIGNVYGILAAPTCTHFSLARTTAKTPRDLEAAMVLVRACLDIVEKCRARGNLKFWALENPVGYLRQMIGKPPLTFNPTDYGANYTKKTDLWGYYNNPKKKPYKMTEEEAALCSKNNRCLPTLPVGYVLPDNFSTTQAKRSITDSFFADAFFKANK